MDLPASWPHADGRILCAPDIQSYGFRMMCSAGVAGGDAACRLTRRGSWETSMVHVAAHLSLKDLAGRLRAARDARLARHVQAIWLLAKGHAMAEVSSTTAFGVRWIEKLLAR